MFILESKWLTFWTFEYTLIWLLVSKMMPSNTFIQKINPLYLLMIISYGYLLIVFYQLIVNKTYYEFSFLLSHILFHFVPLFLFQRYIDVKGNLLFTLLFLIPYFGYIKQQKMTLYDIYLTKRHMQNFKDLNRHIKSHAGIWYKLSKLLD